MQSDSAQCTIGNHCSSTVTQQSLRSPGFFWILLSWVSTALLQSVPLISMCLCKAHPESASLITTIFIPPRKHTQFQTPCSMYTPTHTYKCLQMTWKKQGVLCICLISGSGLNELLATTRSFEYVDDIRSARRRWRLLWLSVVVSPRRPQEREKRGGKQEPKKLFSGFLIFFLI